MKPLRFTRSGRKHRIGKTSARYGVGTCEPLTMEDPGTGVVQRPWVGVDDRGRELEIVAFERTDCWLIVHVMPTHYRRNT